MIENCIGDAMKREKIFTFDFDTSKTKTIRLVLDERSVFTPQTKKEVKVRELGSGKNKKTTISAFDTIYVALNRVEDTLLYLNTLELGKERENQRSAFDFFDFLNNMYVVIHCIRALAIVFGLENEVKEIEKSTECFGQKGINDKGSDHDFFEYVRSLASVHPTGTTMHPAYHGSGKIHCSPFVVWILGGMRREGDLSVHIYTSEDNGDIETLQLYVFHFETYLKKWIAFMDVIVDAIKTFQHKSVDELMVRAILPADVFHSYDQYIENLRKEYKERDNGYRDYILEYYEKLFSIEITASQNENKLKLYKNAIKYSLSFLHTRLQTMSNDEESYTGIIYPEPNLYTELYIELWNSRNHRGLISNHYYELEKLCYLDDSGSFDERYARKLLEGIKPLINKYVVFTNEESAFETKVLVSMALYYEGLSVSGILNRNIPNSLEYRERLLSEEEWNELVAQRA